MKGIYLNGDKLAISIYYRSKRFRLTTIFKSNEEKKADKLRSAILNDLEQGRFQTAYYRDKIKNIDALAVYDINYQAKQKNVYVNSLLEEQYTLEINSDKLTIATKSNKKYVYKFLFERLSGLTINDISVQLVEDIIKSQNLSKKRIICKLQPLIDLLNKAKRTGVIKESPFDLIDTKLIELVSNKSNYKIEPFNDNEVEAIISNCKHPTVTNLIEFDFWSWLRLGECFALKWTDIDFKNEVIHVRHNQTLGKVLKEPKTKAGIRDVEMLPKAKEALLRQLSITKGKERVFLTPNGNIYSKTATLILHWRNTLELCNIKYRNPYQMRHTFISKMLMLGNSPMVIYRLVGHENAEMIYKTYGKFIKQEGNKKLLKLD